MAEAFSLTSRALPSAARVLAFRGTEAISALYELVIHLWIEDPAFDIAPALGADATFSINRQDAQPCVIHGILATLETVDDLEHGAVYRAVLVPRLWQLTLTQHSRVFVGQTAPAILAAVLQGSGMTSADYEMKLSGTYGPLEHVCQYRESNFAFLSRRMEREGIYYFFEQGESSERLVITDDRSFQGTPSTDPVRYYRVLGPGAGGIEGLRSFTSKHTTIPGSVVVKDHDYLRPALEVSGVAPASGRGEEVHLYGENVMTPEEGSRIARVRAEELKARQVVFRGVGNTSRLRPGHAFTLQDHPRQSVDGDYLTTELVHTGHYMGGLTGAKELLGLEAEPDEIYRVELVAIPKGAQFRPARWTPVPRIYGTERAVIDGAADSDYAQLDEHGRYLVKMHIDESPAKDGKASARVRMMQPHGGSPESFHFPLRKGTEVLLTFEGGDPDRPVIAGVVPNLVNPTLVTSRNATKNILQTGGGNRLIIEDAEGKEYIHLATPHKRTFLHMGSTFNPQYNVIKNTDGTSLTYTTLLATSFTGDDSQTIVDRARVTVIGRGVMTTADAAGQEVATLLGTQFITSLEGEEAPDDADASSALLATAKSDQKAAQQAAQTAVNDWTALTIPPAPIPSSWNQTALNDSSATSLGTPVQTSVSSANTWATDPSTQKTIDAVAVASKGASMNTALSNLDKAITALQAATPPTAALLAAVVSAAQALLFAVDALASLLKYDTSNLPDSPNSNVTPTYINIQRASPDATNPSGVTSAPDATGMDIADLPTITSGPGGVSEVATPPKLNPGSDVKIVGGDNVTLVKFDTRSETMGRSYGLVLGGQASVVRNGQQSVVLAPTKNGTGASAILYTPVSTSPQNPPLFTPLTFPVPALDPTSNTAQRSELYGDQFTWVDGTTTSFVLQGKHTRVFAPDAGHDGDTMYPTGIPTPSTDPSIAQTSEVFGNQYSYVDANVTSQIDGTQSSLVKQGSHSEIYAPDAPQTPAPVHTEVTTAQSTALHGDQYQWIDGNVNATITGSKTTQVNGTATSTGAHQESHFDTSYKTTAIASLDLTTMKFALSVLNVSLNGISVSVHALGINNKSLHLDACDLKIIS